MAIIGKFTRHSNGELHGTIITLTMNVKVIFVPQKDTSDNSPKYRLYAGTFEVGAAWEKVSKEGDRYLSVKLDDPSFAAPLHVALLSTDGAKESRLVWSRR